MESWTPERLAELAGKTKAGAAAAKPNNPAVMRSVLVLGAALLIALVVTLAGLAVWQGLTSSNRQRAEAVSPVRTATAVARASARAEIVHTGTARDIATDTALSTGTARDIATDTALSTETAPAPGLIESIMGWVSGAKETPTPSQTPTSTSTPTLTPTPTSTPLLVPTLSSDDLARLVAGITDTPTPAPPTVVVLPTVQATVAPGVVSVTSRPTQPAPVVLGVTPLGQRRPVYDLSIAYQENRNGNICSWQAVAGNVVPLPGYSANGLNIHLFVVDGPDRNANAGSRPQFGAHGFEFLVGRTVEASDGRYGVQLQDSGGFPLSDVFMFPMYADCGRNVAVITFTQRIP